MGTAFYVDHQKYPRSSRKFKSWARFAFRTLLILLMFKCAEIECNPRGLVLIAEPEPPAALERIDPTD
jgi:hypothetical protein